jgi:Metallo-peptidase family M12B Reprolysin-like
MKKTLLLMLMALLISVVGFSQNDKFWTPHNETSGKIVTDKAVARLAYPKVFKLYDLNTNLLRHQLFSIIGNNTSRNSTIITLPNADGQVESFEVYEASNFEPALQALFPTIRAYSGKGITDKYATLKMSISPQGIQTMIFRTDKENEFIEPYSQDHTVYSVFKSQRAKGSLPWTCSTQDQEMFAGINNNITARPESSTGELKTMRLAQSCNGEYSTYFGALQTGTTIIDTNKVLAAFNATLTRCNGVYEKDLALHLNLIPETRFVIFFNPATDPYTTLGAWNGQLQSTLTAVIGAANYDIGHMFGASGGGGNAGCIGCVCGTLKGSGITSPADGIPMGDNFDIDYVVHEVGHQLGGNHSYSHVNEGSGVNKEVGSGITIMGYAGITAQNAAAHSIDIFHEANIEQIQNNLATKTCPITTVITPNNATPVVATVAAATIPISTPFELKGSATDANPGDALTYCWEQNDNGTSATTGVNSVAFPGKTVGPTFISFSPTASPSRTFPRLATILAGNLVTGPQTGGNINTEALSSVGRVLNFRLTVRDNSPYVATGAVKVGQTAFTDVAVTVTNTSGPFMVTAPNSAVSYFAGSSQTITWDVANSTAPPVSCANVKISLSTDGGFTFPTVLAASTPNDGSEVLVIPAPLTTTARIKIESIGNIFFDISNTNFTIAAPPTDFNFGTTTPTTSACPAAATLAVNIPTTVTGTFTNPITLATTSGVPAGSTVTFAPNPATPGATVVATLSNTATLAAGTYTIGVSGTAAGTTVKNTTITYTITAGAPPVITTNSAAATVCAPASATFTVASSTVGVTYQWQSAPTVGGTYTNITGATSASYTTATTAAMNGFGYHCVISTQCGTITSANALLTVNTAAAITTQPTNQTACTGSTATFTAAASGTGVTYQWQSATVVGGPYTNIAGATSASYTTVPLTLTTPTFYQVVATTTTCAGVATSTVATLGVSATTAITTQPSNVAVCEGATATFSAPSTGTGITYQWQVSTVAVPTYTNIPGATSATYVAAGTTAAMSGNMYHVVVTGSCNAVTSNNVMLTVNTLGTITTQPTAQTVCNGVAATFTGAGAGTGVTYQWQSAPTATGAWTNIAGATSATYTTPVTTPIMNGTYYRLVATTTTCAAVVNSNAVLLTVNTVAVIGTQPAAVTACIPNTATFTVAATGTGLGYQWQLSTDGGATFGNIAGATTATYTTVPVVIGMNNNQYKVLVTSTCSATGTLSAAALLTVINPVSVSQNPIAQSGCAGDNFTFNVTAAPSNVTYQWQVSYDNGTTYSPVSGATAAAFTITGAGINMNGLLYRVVVTGTPCGIITTPGAKLTLSYRPTVVLTQPSTSSVNAAVNQGLFTTISPATATGTFTWTKNGTIIPNTLASTSILLPVDGIGTYVVKLKDNVTGCEATSNTVVVTDADNIATGRVFVYPNPVSTTMDVRYNFNGAGAAGTMVNIYDEKGSRVFSSPFVMTATFGRMKVDMSNLRPATYIVYVMDASGKKLASTKVVKVP